MKKTSAVLTLLLLLLSIFWSFKALLPTYTSQVSVPETQFSTDRALQHVEAIAQKPHAVGFDGHKAVRDYIVSQLESIGLKTTLQTGYTTGDWANYSKAINVLARIKGTGDGKAVLLMSHYDSNPHSSLGASDAGSGVATILEGIRAFLAEGHKPKNDIIILITDAEELGLNGADLFVSKHPWINDVGLVLNFEARGSGGPSYMLLETNGGNAKLMEGFVRSNPEYPVANSLAYSIYKLLPNDTDLTVFREAADIDGFNFAFIDDHFDYHTQLDNPTRMDRNSLAHQGSYLMPLLHYFANVQLKELHGLEEHVYFNMPLFKVVQYPFSWAWPIMGLAWLAFFLIVFLGINRKVLNGKDILRGLLPMLACVIINGLVGYFSWPALKWIYPGYVDILQGFPYNGHAYIIAFVLFSLAVCFYIYYKVKMVKTPNLLIAPVFGWLLLCTALTFYLKGASFFVIPVLATMVALHISINQKNPNSFLLLFLGLPTTLILAPLVKMLPVGLGLKLLVASTILTTLLFFLLLPIFVRYRNKETLSFLFIMLCAGFLVSAHMDSHFTENTPKPTSLLYVLNIDEQQAQWATYEQQLSDWTFQTMGYGIKKPMDLAEKTISNKYGSNFSYVSEAPIKEVKPSKIVIANDTVIGEYRHLEICIVPQRNVNRLELFTNPVNILKAEINGSALSDDYLRKRQGSKLVTHYITDNSYTDLSLVFPKNSPLELSIYEASNDLLTNPIFTIPPRPENAIPMPFVLNDAVLTVKKMNFD